MAGTIKRLVEGWVNKGQGMQVNTDSGKEIVNESTEVYRQIVEAARAISNTRKSRTADYTEMSVDPLIMSAAELYADDATAYDEMRQQIVWVEGEDKKLIDTLNTWLHDIVDVDSKIWAWAYEVVLWGEIYLRTYASDSDSPNKDRGNYFELVKSGTDIAHLYKQGKEQGYAMFEGSLATWYPRQEFIHFFSDKTSTTEEIKLQPRDEVPERAGELETYMLVYGNSFFEAARQAYKIMSVIELVLLTARLSRSNAFRLVQIEVGNSSAKDTQKTLSNVRKTFLSSSVMNTQTQTYEQRRSSVPINGYVFSTLRNGKGQITVDDVGGQFDVKDLLDVEHFRNKLFAALKIPKAYLGYEEALPGGIGDTSLVRMDARYARSVQRVKEVLKSGVGKMIDFFMEMKGLTGKYTVCMPPTQSSDSAMLVNDLTSRTQSAEQLRDFIFQLDGATPEMKKATVDYISKVLLRIPGMSVKGMKFEGEPESPEGEEQEGSRGFNSKQNVSRFAQPR